MHPDGSTPSPSPQPGLGDLPMGLPDDIAAWAVFLDVDGTLLDLAQTPGAVTVPDGLLDDLTLLARRTGGALALVTGRPIAFIDRILEGHGLPVAGLHGAETRDAAGAIEGLAHSPGFAGAKKLLEQSVSRWPGVIFEDKGAAMAAHYRMVPQFEAKVRAFMEELVEGLGDSWLLQGGKFVFEIRPAGHDKGDAVERFMRRQPFSGRRPLVLGDDLTDEAMFKFANDAGGLSGRIGSADRPTAAQFYVDSPQAVRDWIARVARGGDYSTLSR